MSLEKTVLNKEKITELLDASKNYLIVPKTY